MKILLAGSLALAAAWFWYTAPTPSENQHMVDSLAVADLPANSVVLFATAWCSKSREARKLFDELGVTYFEYDVEKSDLGKEEYRKISDTKGVPLVYRNGEFVVGFNEPKIRALLGEG